MPLDETYYVIQPMRIMCVCIGINSAVGAVMAFTAVASDVIIEKHDDAWLMDPIVGYVFTIFFALYGVW
jgi:hypothetical protein